MARVGYVETIVGSLEAQTKKAIIAIFEYVLKNLRWGRPGNQERAENLAGVFLTGTTHAVANTEFSIEHGLESAPYLLIPVLDLQTANSELVPLTVTQPADGRRIYLSSSETSAPFTVLVEG